MKAQNIGAVYRAVRASGNEASDQELVKYLFTQKGYLNWDSLTPDDQAWIVTNVTQGPLTPAFSVSAPTRAVASPESVPASEDQSNETDWEIL